MCSCEGCSSASATPVFVLMVVSGVRSSCEASPVKRRTCCVDRGDALAAFESEGEPLSIPRPILLTLLIRVRRLLTMKGQKGEGQRDRGGRERLPFQIERAIQKLTGLIHCRAADILVN